MKYHIPKGTKIRRLRWVESFQPDAFVTTRDVTYSDSDVVAMVEAEQAYIEFRIPLPNDAGVEPTAPEPKELSPFKSIKVLRGRIEFIAESESEEVIRQTVAAWYPDKDMYEGLGFGTE